MPDITADVQHYKNANAFAPPPIKPSVNAFCPLLSRTECKYVNYPRVFRRQLCQSSRTISVASGDKRYALLESRTLHNSVAVIVYCRNGRYFRSTLHTRQTMSI